MNESYHIQRIEGSDKYRVLYGGVEIATELSFHNAVVLVENTMYCNGNKEAADE